ncbi:MAG: hypothetical protein HYY81_05905, partial [Deltaproteobacteria bacterium]|nr:hypothetical protein [Deltaproteobacteria bacterium]
MASSRFFIPKLLTFLLLLAGSAIAQEAEEKTAPQQLQPEQTISREVAPAKPGADLIKTMTAYRVSLEKLLKIYEQEFKKKTREVQERRGFYEKGYISRLELDQSQRELAGAEAKMREVEQKIAETETAIAEAAIFEELLRLPP